MSKYKDNKVFTVKQLLKVNCVYFISLYLFFYVFWFQINHFQLYDDDNDVDNARRVIKINDIREMHL